MKQQAYESCQESYRQPVVKGVLCLCDRPSGISENGQEKEHEKEEPEESRFVDRSHVLGIYKMIAGDAESQ